MDVYMSHRLTSVALLAMAFYAASAHADDSDSTIFSFSGFGSAGLVHSSEHQCGLYQYRLKPDGAGYSHNWSADVDSLLGGRVTAKFTPQLSAVLQVIAEQNYDNSYRPHVEWANIQYQVTPEFSVRVGRTVLPTFLFSGTRKVAIPILGCAPPWRFIAWYRSLPAMAWMSVIASILVTSRHTVQANAGSGQQTFRMAAAQ